MYFLDAYIYMFVYHPEGGKVVCMAVFVGLMDECRKCCCYLGRGIHWKNRGDAVEISSEKKNAWMIIGYNMHLPLQSKDPSFMSRIGMLQLWYQSMVYDMLGISSEEM